jgi:hypothetical protein
VILCGAALGCVMGLAAIAEANAIWPPVVFQYHVRSFWIVSVSIALEALFIKAGSRSTWLVVWMSTILANAASAVVGGLALYPLYWSASVATLLTEIFGILGATIAVLMATLFVSVGIEFAVIMLVLRRAERRRLLVWVAAGNVITLLIAAVAASVTRLQDLR